MRMSLALLLAAMLTASAMAQSADPFAYDRTASLDLQEVSRESRGAAVVRDISFVSGADRTTAYLVAPASGGASYPAILYVHWFGERATTNRTQFLAEAVALAERGVVSLLVDAMWSQPGWWRGRTPETDFAGGQKQVIALRRALDLLLAEPGVDPRRVAFVGHDFGAMFGAVMGAADRRLACYVFMAPTPRLADWYLFNVKPADEAAYRAQLAPLDPIGAVGRLSPAPVFYQFATDDKYVPPPRPTEFYDATKPRKHMSTYETEHQLALPEVAADRVMWLKRELGL